VTVAVFNSSEDTTDMLRELFEHDGFVVVTAFTHALRDGETDLEGLMRQYAPQVIVYDIALPYEENWRLYQKIRSSPACRDVPFVLTSTNVAQVEKVSSGEPLIEIVGKPYDLDELLQRVRLAAHVPVAGGERRETSGARSTPLRRAQRTPQQRRHTAE
jgi:DNA-binding response OmpR family regulator